MYSSLIYSSLVSLLVGGGLAYQQVIRAAAPDPFIVYANGYYHMTYTSRGDHIEMVRSQTLQGLLVGAVRTVYNEQNLTRSSDIWAPEIHQIDGVWYIFYSSGHDKQDCEESCRPRVLQGCEAPSPYYCAYRWKADLVPPQGFQGGANKEDPYGIDTSYVEIPGHGRYMLTSAKNERNVQSIQIGPLDTVNWRVSRWSLISEPDQPWERNTSNSRSRDEWIGGIAINEGPHPLYHNGQIWISYSASHCQTPNYGLGLLLYRGGDPLNKRSWYKYPTPMLSQGNGNYGTGHNCFFKSPDGKETWLAYHATTAPYGKCDDSRYTIAQRVEWNGGNTPNFGVPPRLDTSPNVPSGENFTNQIMGDGDMPYVDRRFI